MNVPLIVLLSIPFVLSLLTIFRSHIKSYIFRKILHGIAVTIVTAMFVMMDEKTCIIVSLMTSVLLYPLLTYLDRFEVTKRFFVEKDKGEVALSLVLLFSTLIIITLLTKVLTDQTYIGIMSLLMWGFGDAAAALIGIPYGKHKIKNKSFEGSFAMSVISFFIGFIVMYYCSDLNLFKITLFTLISSAVATLTEFYSPSKYDTLTVPLSVALTMLILSNI